MSRTSRRQGTKSTRRTARTVSKERRFANFIRKNALFEITPSQLRKAQRRGLL